MEFAGKMLGVALWLKDQEFEREEIPVRFSSSSDALSQMRRCVASEAKAEVAERRESPPDSLFMHTVDLTSSSPGIFVSDSADGILRVDASSPSFPPPPPSPPLPAFSPLPPLPLSKVEESFRKAEQQKKSKREKKEERAASFYKRKEEKKEPAPKKKKECATDAAECEKDVAGNEKDVAGNEMDVAGNEVDVAGNEEDVAGNEEDVAGDEEGVDDCTRECDDTGTGHDHRVGDDSGACDDSGVCGDSVVRKMERYEMDLESLPVGGEERGKGRKRVEGVEYFGNPVPHDRFLRALAWSDPSPSLLSCLLEGGESDDLCVVEGPPGTGKTHRMISELKSHLEKHPSRRVLVCAPTNVGAADLYARGLREGIRGCLVLPAKHTPEGTPKVRATEVGKARVVFCTLCGRFGPKLWNEEFHSVFVDEAAHCQEAQVWCLLRKRVEYLFLVGDTEQLEAQVSEEGRTLKYGRSLMLRLRQCGREGEMLTVQRRMHPEILSFVNSTFYSGRLSSLYTPPPFPVRDPYSVLAVEGEEKKVGTSFENVGEAEAAAREATELLRHFEKVVVLVPYLAQARRVLSHRCGAEVETIDSYQGKEAEAVVLCTVRTKKPGFWEEKKRMVVALTRARHKLLVLVPKKGAMPPLTHLIQDAKERSLLKGE